MTSARSIHQGLPNNPIIRVKEVEHRRIKNRNGEFESLKRVNWLELHMLGKGVPEKARARFSLPDFGIIFKGPQPEKS